MLSAKLPVPETVAEVAGAPVSDTEALRVRYLGRKGLMRDLFGLLFFASVGMLLDPVFLMDHLGQVIFLVLAVSVGKGLIFFGIAKAFSYGNVIPLAVGLGLFQVGEFSFVLMQVGVATGSIGSDVHSMLLTAAIVTMAVTPIVSGQTRTSRSGATFRMAAVQTSMGHVGRMKRKAIYSFTTPSGAVLRFKAAAIRAFV